MKYTKIILITALIIWLIAWIGPMDCFNHGFYCNMVDLDQIYEEDIQRYALQGQDFEQIFMPVKRHFKGFVLRFEDGSPKMDGELILTVLNGEGRIVDQETLVLTTVASGVEYQVYMNKKLREGETYILRLHAQNFQEPLSLPIVPDDYLPKENVNGNLLLGYAYSKSTFTFPEKVILITFLIAAWFLLCHKFFIYPRWRKCAGKGIALFLFLTALLIWNYSSNVMNHGNTSFEDFHSMGETLVMGCIYAEHGGVSLHEYGLGRYTDIKGIRTSYTMDFLTDENWDQGYSRTEPMLAVSNHMFSKSVCLAGNIIRFANGEEFVIEDVSENGKYLYVKLSADRTLLKSKYGDLSEIQFLDQGGNPLEKGILEDYQSQYGLQGKVFRTLARYMDHEKTLMNLRLLCSFGTAAVFTLLVMALGYKYNKLLAFSFYLVFWLSPWVVNFAHNLYWVEFTWFLPMLIGIICSMKIKDRRYRLLSYGAVWLAVMGKSLCGYEYITNVMLGGIVFFLLDFIKAVSEKDRERGALIFCTVFWFGLFSLLGFLTAICIHAELRGNGSLLVGIQSILEQDVMRRVGGGEMGNFDPVYWDSLNASVWETLGRYFHFSTEIIAGVPGSIFPLLCGVPIGIFIYNYKRSMLNWSDVWMYAVFFAVSASWFILAKPHSYIHLHLNYVLWYFGFVQICIYIICKQVMGKESYAL